MSIKMNGGIGGGISGIIFGMDKQTEQRIKRVPEQIHDMMESVQEILEGITKWTKAEEYIQLRLIVPRILKLLSGMEDVGADIDDLVAHLDPEKEILSINTLNQQKASLEQEKVILKNLCDQIQLSSKMIERSERDRLAQDILVRCRTLENSLKEIK